MRLRRWAFLAGASALGAGAGAAGCGDAFTNAAGGAGDAGASDAAGGDAARDGGGEAGVDAEANGFCSMVTAMHFFCDDFDDRSGMSSATVQGAWDNLTIGGPGSNADIDALAGAPPSPPNTFSSSLGAALSDTVGVAALSKKFTPGFGVTTRKGTISFDALVESYGAGGNASAGTQLGEVLAVSFGDQLSYGLYLFDSNHAYWVETVTAPDGGTATGAVDQLTTGLQQNEWVSVSIALTAPTAVTNGHVVIDLTMPGGPIISALSTDLPERMGVDITGPGVVVGLLVYDSTAPWGVRFDNVLVVTD